MLQWKPKKKKCRECKNTFVTTRAIQPVCDTFECKVAYATKSAEKSATARKKREQRQTKEKLKALDSISDIANDTQRFFNQYVRERDRAAGYGCISCGTKNPHIQYCAGHFRTRGAAGHLRFNEDNVWLQCNKRCNLELSGNIGQFRIELIKRIGLECVEALENNNETHRWTKEELNAIKVKYKNLTKELKCQNSLK